MAVYARADLVKSVLMELRAIDPDETVEPADYVRVNERVQQKLEELYTDSLIPFDLQGDAIPARYMVPLTYCIAADCTGLYPVGDRLQEMAIKAVDGRNRLYSLIENFYAGQTAPAVYY
jgi:hypothetical protein